MKKIVNGQVVEMTPEEMAQMEKHHSQMPDPTPTAEERIVFLEQGFSKITGLLKKWLDI